MSAASSTHRDRTHCSLFLVLAARCVRPDGTIVEAPESLLLRERRGRECGGAEACIVLLDMMMPGMDGGEVLKALANQHRLAAMPVVIVSAQPQQTSRAYAGSYANPSPPSFCYRSSRSFVVREVRLTLAAPMFIKQPSSR